MAYLFASVLSIFILSAEARLPVDGNCISGCRCDAIILLVNCTNAGFETVPDINRNTRALDLNKNALTLIRKSAFESLTNLRYLSLACNKIDEIHYGAFRSQLDLVQFDLQNNSLRKIPIALKDISCLIKLDLSWNKIDTLTNNQSAKEEPWSNLTQLSTLRLDHNFLTILPGAVFSKLINLEFLSLSHNHLVAISNGALIYLNQLEYINLSNNNFTSVSKSKLSIFNETYGTTKTGHIVSVLEDFLTTHTLEIDYTIDETVVYGLIVTSFNGLYKLKRLMLQNNNLHSILRGTFDDLGYLQILHLEKNQIEFVQEGTFDHLLRLRELYLQQNVLRQIPPRMFEPLRNLVSLNLDNNMLKDITPITDEYLFNLNRLSLGRNNIRYIRLHGFTKLKSLEELYLIKNILQVVPAVKGLLHLRVLDLSFNDIREITPTDAFDGTNLEILDLRKNSLETIAYDTFDDLDNLRKVRLGGSKYVCDCRLQWTLDNYFLDWMVVYQDYPNYRYQTDLMLCREPRVLIGLSLNQIAGRNNHRLRCTTYIDSNAVNILLLSWGTILGFFLLIFWIHTCIEFKRKFGIRHPKNRLMNKHYANNNVTFQPFFDENGKLTFQVSEKERFNVVDEETTV